MSDRERIAHFLLKEVARTVGEFHLVDDGDRIAVAVSGGKDSLALLDLLLELRTQVPYDYELLAIHVESKDAGLPDVRGDLEPWFRHRGVPFRFVPMDLPPNEPLPLDCFRCSWLRRKTLFLTSAEADCQRVALGHHADDAAATALMNLLFNGRLETMEPRVTFFDGAFTVIRPLITLPEKELARYGRAAGFPNRPPCPQGEASSRAEVAAFLRSFGSQQKQIRTNLWRAARQAMGF